MHFDFINKFNVKESINKKYNIYAHKNEERYEYLYEHVVLCEKYFFKIINEKGIDEVFSKLEDEFLSQCSREGKELFREMIVNTITMHDMGKINPLFQEDRLGNNLGIKDINDFGNSHHSILSVIIYFDYYFEKFRVLPKTDVEVLIDFMIMNGYIISRHHSEFNSLEEFKEKLDEYRDGEGAKLLTTQQKLYKGIYNKELTLTLGNIEKIFKVNDKYTKRLINESKIYRYMYERLLFSILVACDFYSTSEFMDGVETDDIGNINEINKFYDVYKQGKIYNFTKEYKMNRDEKKTDFSKVKDINILRNELFLEAEENLKENIESNIFYLEAPTGSGKSNVATNLSFKLLEEDKKKNKIFYVYPFNTLVEQNINTLKKIFDKEDEIFNKISVINSVFPIKEIDEHRKNKGEDCDFRYYKKALLNRQFLNYPIVLTTHVTIFKYLFGTAKEDIFPLHQIVNSVIVLDEIQSYRNIIWGEIITFLNAYAKLLNIKVIIMSATLPDLNCLTGSTYKTTMLIKNRDKYFKNTIFKERVKLDFELLKSENILEDLYSHVKKQSKNEKKILVEFISKSSAYNFYRRLKEDEDIVSDIQLMTGDDSPIERERILDLVLASKDIILVATQVIEAGVDIDMDIGYKDISMLDSEEQFLGRINRSCVKPEKGRVFFFNLDKASSIYKQDKRMDQDLTLINEEMIEILKEKDFNKFYKLVIERLKMLTSNPNEYNIDNFFSEEVGNLDFKTVEDKMKLIDEDKNEIAIYLSSTITKKDGEILDGLHIWNEYKELLMNANMEYAEKKVKLSKVRAKMNNFIYKIKCKKHFTYNDRAGELYFIENGNFYFEDGKLNKEKFVEGIGEFL
ncbi:CRISPR-associated helicase Cas3' [Clostridium aciditolerans]|uniref:CRISPR-associated helicase Cas3 n=1 Tax=Clostridium aciditolerans TaxID=339861 RepID=A0A934HRI0_9CLOT|nr:CRISPR-associated helicase Cas3' [Clostridium aciditolerans]MBI6871968.1 CRISPR-associated helicase Cas3' [Clostridium aciditolerans]